MPPNDDSSERHRTPRVVPFAALVLLESALAPLAVWVGWASGQNPLTDFEWTEEAVVAGLAATLPLIGGLWLALRSRAGFLLRIREFLARELAPTLRGCGWPDLALLALAAGVGEELLFRGALQGALAGTLGVAGALVATSLLFGLLHPVSWAYVALAAALGGYLGAVRLVAGNLLAAVVTHAVYDFVALLALAADARPAED